MAEFDDTSTGMSTIPHLITEGHLGPDRLVLGPRPVDQVNHPPHYGGSASPYEAIKVIEAWELGFCLGNCLKYIRRAGKKSKARYLEDLKKARWYLDREITNAEGQGK